MSSGNVLAGSGEWWIDRGKLFPTRDNYPFHESNRTLPYRNLGLVKISREHKFMTVTWDVDAAVKAQDVAEDEGRHETIYRYLNEHVHDLMDLIADRRSES